MNPMRTITILTVFVLAASFTLLTSAAMAKDSPKITKEALRKIMDEDTVSILDVRREKDWSSSEFKIKGAQRVSPKNFDAESPLYPKDNTLVLYCA